MTELNLGSYFTKIASENTNMFTKCGTNNSAKIYVPQIVYNSDTSVYLDSTHKSTKDISSETNAESIVIRDKDGNEVKNTTIVGTGMTVNFNNGEKILTIVVTGDINGDGKVTASDLANLKSAIIGNKILEGAYKVAGDLKEDEEIKGSDLSRLKMMIIGL